MKFKIVFDLKWITSRNVSDCSAEWNEKASAEDPPLDATVAARRQRATPLGPQAPPLPIEAAPLPSNLPSATGSAYPVSVPPSIIAFWQLFCGLRRPPVSRLNTALICICQCEINSVGFNWVGFNFYDNISIRNERRGLKRGVTPPVGAGRRVGGAKSHWSMDECHWLSPGAKMANVGSWLAASGASIASIQSKMILNKKHLRASLPRIPSILGKNVMGIYIIQRWVTWPPPAPVNHAHLRHFTRKNWKDWKFVS